jgi:hypothetical protein
MLEMSAKAVSLLFGFREGDDEYPCYYCGVLTSLLDAERFHVCAGHQREYGEVGAEEMRKRYPLTGKDERNPEFFRDEREHHLVRARALTPEELRLIIQRGCAYEREHAQALLDGKTLAENELEWLGNSAEQFIDSWCE